MDIDDETRSQSHRDENSAPNQQDPKTVKAEAEEQPAETPAESYRTDDAQYPLADDVPHVGARDMTAAGFHAISETVHYAWKHGPLRAIAGLSAMNKKRGFDCPSCAWPDPDGKRKTAEFCENGAKAVAWEATTKRIGPEFFAAASFRGVWPPGRPLAGRPGPHHASHGTRATGPMHYEPISLAGRLPADRRRTECAWRSPDEAMFYTSGRASNEAAFLYRLFARQFGTNNLPDCSNMCHESSGHGADRDHRHRQRARSSSKISTMPTPSSSSARTPAPAIRAC